MRVKAYFVNIVKMHSDEIGLHMQGFRNRVSIFAGSFKTGRPNCSLTILLHVNDR